MWNKQDIIVAEDFDKNRYKPPHFKEYSYLANGIRGSSLHLARRFREDMNVLIAVELSNKIDQEVLDKAFYLTKVHNVNLHLVHAIEPDQKMLYPQIKVNCVKRKAFAKKKINELGSLLEIPKENLFVKIGTVKEVILDLVKSIDAELLLMGNSGRHGIKSLFNIYNSVNLVSFRNSNFDGSNSCSMMTITVTEKEFASAINIAGYQRMLTQKMAKESICVILGIEKHQNIDNRRNTIDIFESNLDALIAGSGKNNIPRPPNNLILSKLNKVKKMWPEYKAAINGSSPKLISELSNTILQLVNQSVKSYEISCYKSGFTESGRTLNVAGSQRMLTQKMAKEFLLVASKTELKKNKDALSISINRFDRSLYALLDGNKDLRVKRPNDREIITGLRIVQDNWKEYKKLLDVNHENCGMDVFCKLDEISLLQLYQMNRVVAMFEKQVY